jgi:hypothetical protein
MKGRMESSHNQRNIGGRSKKGNAGLPCPDPVPLLAAHAVAATFSRNAMVPLDCDPHTRTHMRGCNGKRNKPSFKVLPRSAVT